MAEGRATLGILIVAIASVTLVVALVMARRTDEPEPASDTLLPRPTTTSSTTSPDAGEPDSASTEDTWPQPEGAVASGRAWLGGSAWIDLDNGDQSDDAVPPTADLYVEAGALKHGPDAILTGADALATTIPVCDVSREVQSIPLDQLKPGQAFCVMTNGGHDASVQYLERDSSSIRLGYSTFELGR